MANSSSKTFVKVKSDKELIDDGAVTMNLEEFIEALNRDFDYYDIDAEAFVGSDGKPKIKLNDSTQGEELEDLLMRNSGMKVVTVQ
jgi:hypothetical protein